MQIGNLKQKCGDCFKPTMRRLANFGANDEYECYADSYVKCFWELCDHQKSMHALISKSTAEVITKQPAKLSPYKNPGLANGFIHNFN